MAIEWTEASRDVVTIAEDIVMDYHPGLREARIGFLFRSESQMNGDKEMFAHGNKVPEKLKPLIDFDFIIWIAEDAWKVLSPDRRQALIDHELTHCQFEGGVAKIRPHDIEEFSCIIDRWGLWNADLFKARTVLQKATQAKLFDDATVTMESEGKVVTLTGEQLSKVAEAMGR